MALSIHITQDQMQVNVDNIPEMHSEPYQTSKMGLFAKTPSCIFMPSKNSTLHVCSIKKLHLACLTEF